jgi:hypothetical protein
MVLRPAKIWLELEAQRCAAGDEELQLWCRAQQCRHIGGGDEKVLDRGAEPLVETLSRHLADKRVLIMLDNFGRKSRYAVEGGVSDRVGRAEGKAGRED